MEPTQGLDKRPHFHFWNFPNLNPSRSKRYLGVWIFFPHHQLQTPVYWIITQTNMCWTQPNACLHRFSHLHPQQMRNQRLRMVRDLIRFHGERVESQSEHRCTYSRACIRNYFAKVLLSVTQILHNRRYLDDITEPWHFLLHLFLERSFHLAPVWILISNLSKSRLEVAILW